jgi:hypothetical protein
MISTLGESIPLALSMAGAPPNDRRCDERRRSASVLSAGQLRKPYSRATA